LIDDNEELLQSLSMRRRRGPPFRKRHKAQRQNVQASPLLAFRAQVNRDFLRAQWRRGSDE
jgi:hypothetical protein